jgi:hypothetical protein
VGQQSTQNGRTYQWSGYAWELLTSTGAYTLPTATASVLGGVKVGSGLTITDGVLAASGGGGGGGTFNGTVDGGEYA